MPIVTDSGFKPDDLDIDFVPFAQAGPGAGALELDPDSDPAELRALFRESADEAAPSSRGPRETPAAAPDGEAPGARPDAIKIRFPDFADGRGFTIARQLRLMGYSGRLRASGHVLADQYAMARRSGFDEVEIDEDLAARQPESDWLARANWRDHDYQARLRGNCPPIRLRRDG